MRKPGAAGDALAFSNELIERAAESDDALLEKYLGGETPPRIERMLTPIGPLDADQRARLAAVAERTPVTLAIKNGVPVHTTLT